MKGKGLCRRPLNKKLISVCGILVLLALVLGSSTTALSQESSSVEIVRMIVTRRSVRWEILVEHGGVEMSVSGPGDETYARTFGPGAAPRFGLSNASGDGLYKYNLIVFPVDGVTPPAVDDAQRGIADTIGGEAIVLSGSFAILDGRFVTQVAEEGETPASAPDAALAPDDQLILDDLIVDGSLCVGFDCVNGESFGFDTIRLKENNLRIKFQDTSTSASFPSNDWQITANDSSNGGANKFSIDDIDGGRTPFTIEASAPSHSLYVDDGGRIGVGTNSPVTDINIEVGNTPTVRLEQDGSSGWSPQTWDVAGNEANFFIRDATNGSTLPFRIRPGAPTSSIDIANDGDVGIGTSSPDASLAVYGNDAVALKLVNTGGGVSFQLDSDNDGNFWNVTAQTGATGGFLINNNDGAGVEFALTDTGDLTIEGDYFSTTCTSGNPCAPDYVFEDDYLLMSLEELEAFIKQNKHLPNVPSENDLREAGVINNSQFQMILLEKIEESTLYILQQEQEISQLEARLAEVEQAAGLSSEPQVSFASLLPWILVGVLLISIGMMGGYVLSTRKQLARTNN